jgi:putative spermidine/putrescine transport system substrate-binding protein
MYWLHAVNKLFGGDEDNVSPGMQAVAELVKKNQAIIVENVDHGIKLFQREEVIIMPFWSGRTFALQDGGQPAAIEYVENSVPVLTGFVITKGSAFKELANRFINNTLDPELQLEWTRRFRYPPTNRKAKLPLDLERVRIPDAALERMARLDWKRINDRRAAYLERWNKEVLG